MAAASDDLGERARHRGPRFNVYMFTCVSILRNMPQTVVFPGVRKKFTKRMALKYLSISSLKTDGELFRKWIVAIRRDVGKEFEVTDPTRVCSRHFKSSDYLTSLTGRKKSLKPTAVPSIFFWKQGSPVKRKSPKKRSSVKPEKSWRRGRKQVPRTRQIQTPIPRGDSWQLVL